MRNFNIDSLAKKRVFSIKKLPKSILFIFIFVVIFNVSKSSNLEFQYYFPIATLNNPAPGYLNFNWSQNGEFTVIDNYGNVITERTMNFHSYYRYQLKNGLFADFKQKTYYIYDEYMQLVDTIPNPTNYTIDFHDFIALSNGRYLMLVNERLNVDMSKIVEGGKSNAMVINNRLIETDRTGTIYWEWNSFEHLNILDVTHSVDLTQPNIDYAHINSMFEDENGNILISIRHYDEIALINKSNGEFIWRMGGTYCKNNQYTYTNDKIDGFEGFSHQHTASILENGNILLFDNGNLRENQFSRVVEYSVDHNAKTATKVWEFTNNPPTFNVSMGSAFRLPNGNTLINWANHSIIEVRPDKTVTLHLTFENEFPGYKAQKVFMKGLRYASINITGTGNYNYGDSTGLAVQVTEISNSTMTHLQRHRYKPVTATYSDSVFSEILPNRWVLTPDKDAVSIKGRIKIKVNSLSGAYNPQKLLIFKRDKEATGVFSLLNTTFNQADNEIIAEFTGWGEFVVGVSGLEAPVLFTPENNQTVYFPVNFTWNSVKNADSYQIQLSKNPDFSNIEKSDIVINDLKYQVDELSYNTKYYWRMRAFNNTDTSNWSVINHFYTIISAPVLVTPTNNAMGVKLNESLQWQKVDSASNYQVQVGINSDFLNPLINKENITSVSYDLNNLLPNVEYKWRVRAFKGNDSSRWSEVFTFRTALPAPRLVSPEMNADNINTEHLFAWETINGAENYSIQIFKNDEPTNPAIFRDKITENKILISDLEYGKSYKWQVKAHRKTDSSEWSVLWNFEVVKSDIIVELLSPINDDLQIPLSGMVEWKALSEVDYYTVQVSDKSDFQTTLYDTDVTGQNYFEYSDLKLNHYCPTKNQN